MTEVDAAAVQAARRAAEHAARVSYGRLLALLAARTRDIAASEDALAEALVSALRSWPVSGVPAQPEAWLMTAARHTLSNGARHRAVAEAVAADLALLSDEAAPDALADSDRWPDERLKLLFVCAHPAIDAAVRTPLMLQTVLGLDAAQVAAAFLVAPATMGQRLVRAKAKIKQAGLRFELPTADDLPARLADVLQAVYAAYGTSWDAVAVAGADGGPPDRARPPGGRWPDGAATSGASELAAEALYLGRLLVTLLPGEPEPQGLLALMLHCEARRAARRSPEGDFVPLVRQDTRRWSRDLIIEAEGWLVTASRAGVFGRFQCEAAIQSVHAQRAVTGRLDHQALDTLYALLLRHSPSVGARVGQAAAWVETSRPQQALDLLDDLAAPGAADIGSYQPYWVTRARALAALPGRDGEARAALERAIGLSTDEAVRRFLRQGL